MAINNHLSLLRKLISELRHIIPKDKKVKDTVLYDFILKQYQNNQVTDLQFCRNKDEMAFVARTYALYLNSRRNLNILHDKYGGKELSTEQAAKLVGFKLPERRT